MTVWILGMGPGCTSSELVGNGTKTAPNAVPSSSPAPDPKDYPIAIACAADTPTLSVEGSGPWTATVSGELCPTPSTTGLHVALLIDVSYSMHSIDPQLEGNCGRLMAAKALVELLRGAVTDPSEVHLSVVHFAEEATTPVQDVLLSAADEIATVEVFCASEFEVQGFTNYKAAFDRLPDLTFATDVTRAAYLITDGVPTTGGDAAPGFVEDNAESKRRLGLHTEAGLNAFVAANAVAKARPWTLNALFLGAKVDYSVYDFDPEVYLQSLTGDNARVVVVGAAADLAAAIVALPFGAPGLDEVTESATLRLEGQDAPLEVAALAPTPSGSTWTFSLKPFPLKPTPSGNPHEVRVTAKDVAGRLVTSQAVITVLSAPTGLAQ